MTKRAENDRGATLVLVALSLSAVLSVVGVVVDGGSAFSARRQMQNAADASALSATRAFDKLVAGQEATVYNAAVASAVANGADSASVTCRLVDEVLIDMGACPTTNTGTAVTLKALATGVKISLTSTKPTAFIRVAGINNVTAGANATGQIEGLRSGKAPFVMCAVGSSDPRSNGDGQAVPILLPDNSTNPNAIGREFELQDPTAVGCGQGNLFKGLALPPANYPVPGPWDLLNGDHGVNVEKQVIAGNNACVGDSDTFVNCIVAVPLCYTMSPPEIYKFQCVRYGAFRITTNISASRMVGVLLDGAVATGGRGGGRAEPGEVRVIKLSE